MFDFIAAVFAAAWRRSWGVIAALAICFALALPGVAAAEPVHVAVLLQALGVAQWQPLIAEFERQNPDIKIDAIEGPNATNLLEDLYTTSFLLGDSAYDIVFMDIIWAPKFAAAGWLEDLSDRLSPAAAAEFMPTDLEGGRYQGKLYRLPMQSGVGMLYYRQDLLDAAGLQPPQNTVELMAASQKLLQQGEADLGYIWQGKQYEGLSAMFVEILQGFGGFWVDPATNAVGLDAPEAIAAVQFLREAIESGASPEGVVTYQEEETRRLFQSGKAAFMRNWPYAWSLVNGSDSQVAGNVGIQPMVGAPGVGGASCQGGWGLGMAKTTRHPEAAWRVVEYFTSAAAQKYLVSEYSVVPARRALFDDPDLVAKYDFLPLLLQVIDSAVLRPQIAQYAPASDILQRYLSAAITGRRSPEAAMAAAARETRQLLGSDRN